MPDSLRSRLRLPHCAWILFLTVMLVVAYIGLSLGQPYYHEQQVVREIENLGGNVVMETAGPIWLRELVGEVRLREP